MVLFFENEYNYGVEKNEKAKYTNTKHESAAKAA